MEDAEIAGLYQWVLGACFKCAREEVETTRLGQIDTPSGACYDIRACRSCLLDLERERRRHAERVGERYRPGRLGV